MNASSRFMQRRRLLMCPSFLNWTFYANWSLFWTSKTARLLVNTTTGTQRLYIYGSFVLGMAAISVLLRGRTLKTPPLFFSPFNRIVKSTHSARREDTYYSRSPWWAWKSAWIMRPLSKVSCKYNSLQCIHAKRGLCFKSIIDVEILKLHRNIHLTHR